MESLTGRLKILQGEASQAEFSAKIGLTQTRWGRFIRGESQPDAESLQTICNRLNVHAAWLLLGTGPMRISQGSVEKIVQQQVEQKSNKEETTDGICLESFVKLEKLNERLFQAQEREIALLKENAQLLRESGQLLKENAQLKAELAAARTELTERGKQVTGASKFAPSAPTHTQINE